MSLLLSGGTVVTSLHPVQVADSDVLISGDRVEALGEDTIGWPEPGSDGVERIDCGGCLLIPGNVNAHTHLYSALARGMPYALEPPADFVQILQRVWWRLDRALDEESIRASALVGGLEALRSGTTTVIDHHASPEAIDGSLEIVAEALASLGLRSVCCYEVSDRDGPERAAAGLAENGRFLERVVEGAYPLARGMVGAHASFTLSDATLAACVEAARSTSTGLHVHVAEDAADERDSVLRHGVRVAERLHVVGALDERALLAHGVHLDADEAHLVDDSGAMLVHNPRSNMNNAVGRAPLHLLGERVALGTDGIGADMFAESQAAFFRLRDEAGTPAPGWPLERLAQGAAFAGRAFEAPSLGRLEPGAPADIAILDYAAPAPLDASSLAGHWTYGLGSRHVRDVIVAGRPVIRDRRSTLVDEAALISDARLQAARLWDRLASTDIHPFDPQLETAP